jgi:hypothetical protein
MSGTASTIPFSTVTTSSRVPGSPPSRTEDLQCVADADVEQFFDEASDLLGPVDKMHLKDPVAGRPVAITAAHRPEIALTRSLRVSALLTADCP